MTKLPADGACAYTITYCVVGQRGEKLALTALRLMGYTNVKEHQRRLPATVRRFARRQVNLSRLQWRLSADSRPYRLHSFMPALANHTWGALMNKPQKSETQLLHTQVCRKLDPTRIMTLYLLASGPKSVGELAAKVGSEPAHRLAT
ncbi:MAG: hypothetical protein U0559_01160 [Anaerolineae bacterium]